MSWRRGLALRLERLGLQRPAYRIWEWGQTLPALPELIFRSRRRGIDGLPLPPPILRVQVTGTASPEEFIAQSHRAAETIHDVIHRVDRDLEGFEAILDFGCGCGRVMRRWSQLTGPTLFGSDYNADLVAWCRNNLPFAHFAVNGLAPPLPFPVGQFDLVYALSVFTHLTTRLQHGWISELERVIRPGGLLVFTTRGQAWAWKLTPEERGQYDAGEVVVRYGDVTGTNLCAAFHPVSFVHERLANGFRVRETFPSRLADGAQDVHVLERPG